MKRQYTIVGLGELLWDLLPSGKQLGGAPANFAYVSRLLGDDANVASRIGVDELGTEALARLKRRGLSPDHLQSDPTHPTGTIQVTVDDKGEPSYRGTHDAAWDHLEWTPNWAQLAKETDAVGFGSLAQRSSESRTTILRFLDAMRPDALRLFDVNLRHSFFSRELLEASLLRANLLKLNQAEVPRLQGLLDLPDEGLSYFAGRLLTKFSLRLIAITRGPDGSLIATPEGIAEHPGIAAKVKDTIGAGDAFGAALVHGYLRSAPQHELGEMANRVGAWMTTQVGAMPGLENDLWTELKTLND